MGSACQLTRNIAQNDRLHLTHLWHYCLESVMPYGVCLKQHSEFFGLLTQRLMILSGVELNDTKIDDVKLDLKAYLNEATKSLI
jgi:hypothetical protein